MTNLEPLGFVAYDGPSRIDGERIVVLVTTRRSENPKTGDMVQTWILPADVHPVQAARSGADRSVCGDCRLRPVSVRKAREEGRDVPMCYVGVGRAPAQVWRSWQRGRYVAAPLSVIAAALSDRMLRIGSYGDPGAVPVQVWEALAAGAAGWTGYTHQWITLAMQPEGALWAKLLMASTDNPAERGLAHASGWRSFRVSTDPTDRHPTRETRCPASAEGGHRTTCTTCRLCAGASVRARDVVILDHSPGAKRRVMLAVVKTNNPQEVAA